jgi:hypothetical protein
MGQTFLATEIDFREGRLLALMLIPLPSCSVHGTSSAFFHVHATIQPEGDLT